ncbi:MAG: hypothetical protein H6736_18205 [Alphaproteobacteria bacterium]|nr:hypothetical protein [Alphaproteobacteria bacterium]MCB9693748.1 hypothetical protein [Alphaproteobacteria bacterium]
MAKRPVRLRVPPGLEDLAAAELVELGCDVEVVPGGVLAPRADLPKVLVGSRIGSGVTLQLGHVRLDSLPDALRGMPWQSVLTGGQRVEVVLRGVRGRGIEGKCEAVIARHAAKRGGGARLPALRVWLIAEDHRAEVAVEAARDLWKRGWRTAPGRAPLRENLAAAVLRACNWTGSEPLVDPMCGSGTFGIEAALIALGRAPGAHTRFAASFWPGDERGAIEREQKKPAKGGTAPSIRMSDRDTRQLGAARANASRARVDRHVRIEEAAFDTVEPPDRPGLVVLNPPYGDRLAGTEKTYRHVAAVLEQRWEGWRYGVLLPDGRLGRFMPGEVDTEIRFTHGGKRVWLARGRIS